MWIFVCCMFVIDDFCLIQHERGGVVYVYCGQIVDQLVPL